MATEYITRSGDTWDLIAYNELGATKYVDKLIDANREYINTAIFSAGTVLEIPTIDEKTTPRYMPPWKR